MQAAGLQHRQLLAAAYHTIMAGLMQLSNDIQTCSMHVCIGLRVVELHGRAACCLDRGLP